MYLVQLQGEGEEDFGAILLEEDFGEGDQQGGSFPIERDLLSSFFFLEFSILFQGG